MTRTGNFGFNGALESGLSAFSYQRHFRTNRSSRLSPAHQGMQSWSCGLVWRIGTAHTPLDSGAV